MLKHLLRGRGSGIQGNSWVATIGNGEASWGNSVAVAPDGSVYIYGTTYAASAGGTDSFLAKFSSSGTVQWQKTLGDSDYDEGNSVAVAPDGSVYVCGIFEYTGIEEEFLLAKFSSSGTVQWQKTLGGSDSTDLDYGCAVAVGPDDSVYICGYSNSCSRGYALILAKFSSSGTVQWQKLLNSGHSTFGYAVAVGPDGSVYVCGRSDSGDSSTTTFDFLLAKFSSSGTFQWQKILDYNNYEYDCCNSVAVAPDGSIYVCGYSRPTPTGRGDLFIAKFSSSGTVQWQKTLGVSDYDDVGQSVAVAPDGSVYVCGNVKGALFLAKFSSSGTVQWQKTLDCRSYTSGHSVAVAPDGSVYVCGNTSAGFLLAKITDFLVEKDIVTIGDFTFQDVAFTVNNISLTSVSNSFSSSDSCLTVRTSSLTVGTPSLPTKLYTYEE